MHGRNRERILADETTALARSKPHYLDEDFETIHEAVLETARGRWFLQEYARRNRSADTGMLLTALARIESATGGGVAGGSAPAPLPDLQLLELRDAIALTKDNLAALGAKSHAIRSGDFAGVAAAVGNLAARLRATFERLQETAWTLRDRDGAASLCDALEAQAREIVHVSGVLDEVGAGAVLMGDLLNEVEDRVGAMIAQASQERDGLERSRVRAPAVNEVPADMQPPAPHTATPESGQEEAGSAVILAFDSDYERMMSEAVEAALLSEHEGAEWHLPANAENVPTGPDLSDQVFEALAAEADLQAATSAAEPPSQLDAASLGWIESLAPAVGAAEDSTPRPFEDIEFPPASGKSAAASDDASRTLPNIASRERDDEPPASVTDQVSAAVQDEIEAAMADIRDAVQAQLAEDIQPQPAKPARPADPLAPIMALSDEEKIALFS